MKITKLFLVLSPTIIPLIMTPLTSCSKPKSDDDHICVFDTNDGRFYPKSSDGATKSITYAKGTHTFVIDEQHFGTKRIDKFYASPNVTQIVSKTNFKVIGGADHVDMTADWIASGGNYFYYSKMGGVIENYISITVEFTETAETVPFFVTC